MTHASRKPRPPDLPVTAARPGWPGRASRDTPLLPAAPVCAAARPATGTAVPVTAMTASTVIRKRLTVLGGCHDQARAARVFTTAALSAHHPCAPIAALLVSELVTNSMLYSDSRLPGGTITITVTGSPARARVEVRDAGGVSVPAVTGTGDALAEGGRGLRLVSDLAARWGYRREPDALRTWFEVRAEPPPP